jgi:hypothetical protein
MMALPHNGRGGRSARSGASFGLRAPDPDPKLAQRPNAKGPPARALRVCLCEIGRPVRTERVDCLAGIDRSRSLSLIMRNADGDAAGARASTAVGAVNEIR